MTITTSAPNAFYRNRRVEVRIIFYRRLEYVIGMSIIPRNCSTTDRVITTLELIMSTTIRRHRRVNMNVRVINMIMTTISNESALLYLSAVAPRLHRISFTQFMVPAEVVKSGLLTLITSMFRRRQGRVQVNRLGLINSCVRVECVRHDTCLVSSIFRGLHALLTLRVYLRNALGNDAISQRVSFQGRRRLILVTRFRRLSNLFWYVRLSFLALRVL